MAWISLNSTSVVGSENIEGGTRLTVTESGFENLPADRRNKAFRENESGWTEQLKNIESYVAQKATSA
jgi:hypothetical protein